VYRVVGTLSLKSARPFRSVPAGNLTVMSEPTPTPPVPGPTRPAPGPVRVPVEEATTGRDDQRFAGLEEQPVSEHVAVFEAEHARLQRELGTIDEL
jgi:hypothetical protein